MGNMKEYEVICEEYRKICGKYEGILRTIWTLGFGKIPNFPPI